VRTVADEVLREFYVHGVSVVETVREGGEWRYQRDSHFNRRVHTLTDMELSGPAGKTPYMVTKYSPDGGRTRGTINNCASGHTPWGTYLTCEENWAGYFRRIEATDNPNRSVKELTAFSRYGVRGTGRELWATVTPDTPDDLYGRWNAMKLGSSTDGSDDYRNGPNTYGWVGPDGLWFSQATGVLWIETDDGADTDVTNCMLLAAVPGEVGDGGARTIVSSDGTSTRSVDTYVGKPPGEENLRRFLVGPKESEITGVAETPDGKALFVNIQHPGEDTRPDFATGSFGSHWPDGGLSRPRSATIVITRADGGRIGI